MVNGKEKEKESLEEDCSFLGDSFFEKNVSALESERRSQNTAEPRLDVEKSNEGKTVEIGEGLPITNYSEEKKKNGSMEVRKRKDF